MPRVIDYDLIDSLLLQGGYNAIQIANKAKCGQSTVEKRRRKKKLPSGGEHKRYPNASCKEFERLWGMGHTDIEISNTTGYPVSVIKRWRISVGAERNDSLRRWDGWKSEGGKDGYCQT